MNATINTPVTNLMPAKLSADWMRTASMQRVAVMLGIGQAAVDGGLAALQKQEQIKNGERARAVHEGWQLHFTFDMSNDSHVREVRRVMQDVMEYDQMVTYRMPQNDSVAGIVFVGSLESTKRVASNLEGRLEGIVAPLSADQLHATVPLSPRNSMWGCFNIEKTQPIPKEDSRHFGNSCIAGIPLPESFQVSSSNASMVVAQSFALLNELYGTYFNDGTLPQLLQNRNGYIRSLTKGVAV